MHVGLTPMLKSFLNELNRGSVFRVAAATRRSRSWSGGQGRSWSYE